VAAVAVAAVAAATVVAAVAVVLAAVVATAAGNSVVESGWGFESPVALVFGSLTSNELSCSSEVMRVRGSGAGCISRSGTGEGALALSGMTGESKSAEVGGGDAGAEVGGGDAGAEVGGGDAGADADSGSRSDAAGICAEVVSMGCPSACASCMAGMPPTGAGVIELMSGQRL
jgi:hypothetical protein